MILYSAPNFQHFLEFSEKQKYSLIFLNSVNYTLSMGNIASLVIRAWSNSTTTSKVRYFVLVGHSSIKIGQNKRRHVLPPWVLEISYCLWVILRNFLLLIPAHDTFLFLHQYKLLVAGDGHWPTNKEICFLFMGALLIF